MKLTPFIRALVASIAIQSAICSFLTAQETTQETDKPQATPPPPAQTSQADPFAEPAAGPGDKPTIPDERLGVKLPTVQLRLEIWETSAIELAKHLDGVTTSKAIEQLRGDYLTGKTAATLIASPCVALDPSSRATSESISEWIYPTEYEAGEISPSKEIPTDKAFSSPTSFETRNTGETFEATARQVTAEEHAWDVAISYENVGHAGDLKYGKPELLIQLPLFTDFRVRGTHRLQEGRWHCCSIQTPPKGMGGDDTRRWVCLLRVDPLGN